MNGKEPLSRYGQISNDIEVERQPGNWIDAMVEDKRAAVADQVAAKMDVGAWFATLTKRMKEIAKDLAFGCSTSEVAEKHGVSCGEDQPAAAGAGRVVGGVSAGGGAGGGLMTSR